MSKKKVPLATVYCGVSQGTIPYQLTPEYSLISL
jgi:hypothetical protein